MNEITAYAIGQNDGQTFLERLASMQSPQDIEHNFIRFVARRVQAVDQPRAKDLCRALMAKPRIATLSQRLGARIAALLQALEESSDPEASRSLMLWLVGSPSVGPAFSQAVLEAIPDRGTQEAIRQIQDSATRLRTQLDAADKELLSVRLRELPLVLRKIANGMLYQARFSYECGDAERYRTKLETVRIFIEKHAPRKAPAAAQGHPRRRPQPPAPG